MVGFSPPSEEKDMLVPGGSCGFANVWTSWVKHVLLGRYLLVLAYC